MAIKVRLVAQSISKLIVGNIRHWPPLSMVQILTESETFSFLNWNHLQRFQCSEAFILFVSLCKYIFQSSHDFYQEVNSRRWRYVVVEWSALACAQSRILIDGSNIIRVRHFFLFQLKSFLRTPMFCCNLIRLLQKLIFVKAGCQLINSSSD